MQNAQDKNSQARLESIAPRLPVQDVEAALGFYLDSLGFSLGWKWGTPLTHANVCRDTISVDLVRVPPANAGTAMAYVQVARIDAYNAELKARGAPVSAIGNRDYGMRDFEVVDPDGNRLAFGEPVSQA